MSLIKFEPKSYTELQQMSVTACKSGLMPHGMTPEKFMIIAMKGAELGLPILQSIYSINVINNKPAISAELMLALIYNRVPSAKVTFIETTDSVCTIEAQRTPNDKVSPFTFSMVEAQTAGLLNKESWKKYPAAMLRARCISAMARAIFPDALMGASYTPEELGNDVEIEEDGEPVVIEKTNQQKWDELPEDIKTKFEALAVNNDIQPRIDMCAKVNFDIEKIRDGLNKLQEKRNPDSKPDQKEPTDEERLFMLSEDIKQLFDSIDPKSTDKKKIEWCKTKNWNEQVIRFELKRDKENLDKALNKGGAQ